MNTYPGTTSGNLSFVTNGYVNQALFLTSAANQSVVAPYIPLANTSFTVETWIKPTLFANTLDHSILSLCPSPTINQCLHIVLRRNGSNVVLYFGFYLNDCAGNTPLSVGQWVHAAFVFDLTTMRQSIYLNGQIDCTRIASAPLMVTQGNVTIGAIPTLLPNTNANFYQVSCLDDIV